MIEFLVSTPLWLKVAVWTICCLAVAFIETVADAIMMDSRLNEHYPKWLLALLIILGPIGMAIIALYWAWCLSFGRNGFFGAIFHD